MCDFEFDKFEFGIGLSGLQKLYQDASTSDVCLISSTDVHGEKIPCHKLILAAASPYLKKYFMDEKSCCSSIITLHESKETIILLLKCIYSVPFDIHILYLQQLNALYCLSNVLLITELGNKLVAYIKKKYGTVAQITPPNKRHFDIGFMADNKKPRIL